MPPKLVLFDFDGTLADSFEWLLHAYDDVAVELGLRRITGADLPALRGMPTQALMRQLGVPAWRIPQIALRLRKAQAREIGQIQLFEGMPEVLEALAARGVTLGVVTSNAEANVRAVLGPGLAARITRFACGAPLLGKASQLRRALREIGVAPSDAFAIGDELRDLDAAHEAGIPFGAVAWGYADPEVLRAASPDAIFDRPADILAALMPPELGGPAGV